MKHLLVKFILLSILLFSLASPARANVFVNSFFTKTGTFVASHFRSSPNKTIFDNYSTKPNINPFTGKKGTVDPLKQAVKKITPSKPAQIVPVVPVSTPTQPGPIVPQIDTYQAQLQEEKLRQTQYLQQLQDQENLIQQQRLAELQHKQEVQQKQNSILNEWNQKNNEITQKILDLKQGYYAEKARIEAQAVPMNYINGQLNNLIDKINSQIAQLQLEQEQLRLDYLNKVNQVQ
jgi:hypothetical protein